jgi:uncharacterized lipoprotein YmbA
MALVGAACGASTPSRFYTLESTVTANDPPAARYAVVIGPVSVPAAVDRPQLVVQVAPNRVEIDEFNRWVAPLNDGIGRADAGDLAALLGTPDVAIGPAAGVVPAYRVTLDVQRFESVPGTEALVDVIWVVRATADSAVRSGRTVSREAVSAPGIDALAAAHSRALARVSHDIAVAIRAEAASAEASPSARPGADKR